MTKTQTKIITALTITAFILAMLVSGRFWFRLDTTKNKTYTISKISRNIYRELPNPVDITYYLSARLKAVDPASVQIEDTLREYAAHSRGKIRLTVRDPSKPGVAANAEEFRLQPRQLRTVEQDQASIVTLYSGIVIEYLDKVEVLPLVVSTATLEYDLTSRIRSMVTDSERWIGIIVGDSFRQWSEDFGYLDMTLAGAGYRVRQFSSGEEIPANCPVLFVLGGVEELDQWALYRIDMYIQQGGKVFFAVKGIFVDTIYGTIQARHQEDRGLLEMIASYGVTVRREFALDRNGLPLQYQSQSPYGGVQNRIVRYPLWIGVTDGNEEHPISSAFAGIDLYWASPLELHEMPSVEAVSIFNSSEQAWAMKETLYTSPEVPYMLEMESLNTKGVKILGAALSGEFPSFFRGYPKPFREGSQEELPDIPEQARESRIIVVGDVDFATNIMNATQAVQNLDFLLRVADWLSSDDDIIGIRSKQPHIGRLDKIQDIPRRVAAMRFSRILNIGLIPAFVIAAGLFLASRRRLRSETEGRAAKVRETPADSQTNSQTTENNSEREDSNDV